MKIYALILVCALTYYVRGDVQFTKEAAIAAANECKEESGATDADVEAMFKHEPAGSTEAKCLRACAMKKFGILSDDGKLVKETALKLVQIMSKDDAEKEALGEEIVNACEDIEVSEDHCEAAEEYGECIKKEAEERDLKWP